MNIRTIKIAEEAAEAGTNQISWSDIWQKIIDWAMNVGIKILIALFVMFIAFKIINFLTKRLYKHLQKKQVDETISRVSYNTLRLILKGLVLVCLVGYVGIETASISAVIASLGVGISLAVQGTLSNFAGGVIIVLMRPFKIGDYITTNGESGTVEDIKLFYTNIVTPDNKLIMIPNGQLANNVIVNTSAKEDRRCDVVMSIAYTSDIELAKRLIREVCEANELIYKTPAPFVEIKEFAASSIDLTVRVWCKRQDYWTVNFYLLNEIKKALDENGIEIPFNQLDVTIKQETNKK